MSSASVAVITNSFEFLKLPAGSSSFNWVGDSQLLPVNDGILLSSLPWAELMSSSGVIGSVGSEVGLLRSDLVNGLS